MRVYLAGLGWVNEAPAGHRLRWMYDLEEESRGAFVGLPIQATLERALIHFDPMHDTIAPDDPTNAVPANWWDNLGVIPVELTFPPSVVLPRPVQALRFQYQGPETSVQVLDEEGTIVLSRRVHPFENIRLNAASIHELRFFASPANLVSVQALDLFDEAHAAGLNFERIAILSPRTTVGMTHATAYQRYTSPPSITEEDWTELQRVVFPAALESTPELVAQNPEMPGPWRQIEWMIAARWEHAVVHGMGFVDGPGAGPGAPGDQQNLLLHAPGNQLAVYRVTCRFADLPAQRSNLVCIRPQVVPPLVAPIDLEYVAAEVRLFGERTYTVTALQRWQIHDRRAIGVEIEEQRGESAILNTLASVETCTFRSRATDEAFPSMSFRRRFDVSFYDVPLRYRARSIDGWDRESAFSSWSPEVTPVFIHNPAAPPLHTARHADGETTLIARTEHYDLAEWTPDHAVANTPGSVLQAMHRVSEPDIVQVNVSAPEFHDEASSGQVRLHAVPVPSSVSNPERFLGGYLLAGGMRAEILGLVGGRFIFEALADSTGTAALFEAGPATLQQAPNHPDLFSVVTSVPVDRLSGFLTFAHPLPPPVGKTGIESYAWRVRMGTVVGAIGNLAAALRVPTAPAAPPPFSVELLGVDFYDRTLVRIELTTQVPSGRFSIFWASGTHEAASFAEAAMAGSHGAQPPHHQRYLYELLPLPVPRAVPTTVTFGLRQERTGGHQSPFTRLHYTIQPYAS